MSALDALFGKVFYNGGEIELGGGLNFTGVGVGVAYNTGTRMIDITISGGGGGGGHVIESNGTPLTQRANMNVVGLSAADSGGKTVLTGIGPAGTVTAGRIVVFSGTTGNAVAESSYTPASLLAAADAAADAGDAVVAALIPAAGGAPGAVNLSSVAASAGTDPDYARQDHVHSLSGVLPVSLGGNGVTLIAGSNGTNANTTYNISDGNYFVVPAGTISGGAKNYTWAYSGTPVQDEIVVFDVFGQSSDLNFCDSTIGTGTPVATVTAGSVKWRVILKYSGANWLCADRVRFP